MVSLQAQSGAALRRASIRSASGRVNESVSHQDVEFFAARV